MRGMFEGQKQSRILHTAIAAVSKRENQITGITILYHFGKIIHWRYYGSDYRIDNNNFRYFILGYYHSIDYAEKNGVREYRLSVSSLLAKTSREDKLESLAALLLLLTT